MTDAGTITLAMPDDTGKAASMVRRLAFDLGERAFASNAETLLRRRFGPEPALRITPAQVAARGTGMALFFGCFSTTRGQPGAFMQDPWVDPGARAQGLGRRFLLAVAA